jgi:hypothetical protein
MRLLPALCSRRRLAEDRVMAPHLLRDGRPDRALSAVSIAPQPDRRASACRPVLGAVIALLVLLAVALLVRP